MLCDIAPRAQSADIGIPPADYWQQGQPDQRRRDPDATAARLGVWGAICGEARSCMQRAEAEPIAPGGDDGGSRAREGGDVGVLEVGSGGYVTYTLRSGVEVIAERARRCTRRAWRG